MLPTQSTDLTLYGLTKETAELEELLCMGPEASQDDVAAIQAQVTALLQSKVDSCVGYSEFLQDKEHAVDNAIEKLQAMKKTLQNRRESFHNYIKFCMENLGTGEVRGSLRKITLSPPTKVIKIDEKLVPVEFLEVQKVIKVKKTEIKALLKTGQEIPGAWLEAGERPLRFGMNLPKNKKKEEKDEEDC